MDFIDTAEDFDFLTEAGYERCLEQGRQAERDGYIKLPGWFPGGLPGYDWQIFGMDAYMKPKPKLRHVLRYKYQPEWYGKWKAKRFINKLLKTG